MITNEYAGGLGNLLFQVTAGVILAKRLQTDYKINPHLHVQKGQGNFIQNYLTNIFKNIKTTDYVPIIKISEDRYETILNGKEDLILTGYYQNYKYIKDNHALLNGIYGFTNSSYKNICTIQIRTGDFLHQNIFNVVTSEYFKKCIDYIKNIDSNVTFVVITDYFDIAKKYLPSCFNYDFYHLNELEDLKLMSESKYCIISNSSFGWWGSFLGHKKVTLAPKNWFKDKNFFEIYRDDMIKIDL